MKPFFITIDTEGDNQWEYRLESGTPVTTENARFLPRFQDLCERFGFKPVYLTDWEMANDAFFADFARKTAKRGACEIGMHPHAWSVPPEYPLECTNKNAVPYLIEYPLNIMCEKLTNLLKLLENTFETEIISHRSGRWAMNSDYYDLLIENNVKIDCSVTPFVSWRTEIGCTAESCGSDYSASPTEPYMVFHSMDSRAAEALLEMPVSIRKLRIIHAGPGKSGVRKLLSSAKGVILGRTMWLRPEADNLAQLLFLTDRITESSSSYLMFMLHSSELMPGGSPNFKTTESIEKLYSDLEILFKHISGRCEGKTLREYYEAGDYHR
jgi:hypothetical protein